MISIGLRGCAIEVLSARGMRTAFLQRCVYVHSFGRPVKSTWTLLPNIFELAFIGGVSVSEDMGQHEFHLTVAERYWHSTCAGSHFCVAWALWESCISACAAV